MKAFLTKIIFVLGTVVRMIFPPSYSLARLERYYKSYIGRHPETSIARYALATLYNDFGRFTDARRELEVILKTSTPTDSTLQLMGEVCFRLGDYSATISYLESMSRPPQSNKFYSGYLGMSHAALGNYDKALPHLLLAVELPVKTVRTGKVAVDEGNLHEAIGFCLLKLGRFDQAVKSYQKALRLGSVSPERRNNAALAHAQYANALLKAGRFDDAFDEFQSALDLKPESAIAESITKALEEIAQRVPPSRYEQN